MIPVWIKKLIDGGAVDGLRRIAMRLHEVWPFIVAALIVWFAVSIIRSANELKDIRLNQKDVKLWNKKIETTAEDDSLIVRELRKLRENEVAIIYTYQNEEVHIKRIPNDSLQFWADSLYNSPN